MRLLMCDRVKDAQCEAEPVLVSVDDGWAILELDDGERLAFRLSELEAALAIDALAEEAA
jgi:hypothetical protein